VRSSLDRQVLQHEGRAYLGRLFDAGIAYPERVADRVGSVESGVGWFKFHEIRETSCARLVRLSLEQTGQYTCKGNYANFRCKSGQNYKKRPANLPAVLALCHALTRRFLFALFEPKRALETGQVKVNPYLA
jgi:hypothetical protein